MACMSDPFESVRICASNTFSHLVHLLALDDGTGYLNAITDHVQEERKKALEMTRTLSTKESINELVVCESFDGCLRPYQVF